MAKIIYVPEECEFESVDDAMGVYPESAVSGLVSGHSYHVAVQCLKRLRELPHFNHPSIDKVLKELGEL